jgi:HAD superfamily hydrolase (TIGR01509 family)
MKLPTLIFDLGGVLLRIDYARFIEKLGLGLSMDEEELLRLLTPDGQLYETGKLSTREFFQRLSKQLEMEYDESRLYPAWLSILAGEINGMRELISRLSSQNPLFLLSNTNELHFTYSKEQFPILKFFKQYFVSYQIGAMKPTPEIYKHVIQSLGANPSDLLFFDDVEKNVLGAQQAGMRSFLFTGVDALRSRLEQEGFPIA